MLRIKFNKPGRYIARNMADLYEVEDVNRVYEVADDFVVFNEGLVTIVQDEPVVEDEQPVVEDEQPVEDEPVVEAPSAEDESGDKLKNRRRSRARRDDGAELLG